MNKQKLLLDYCISRPLLFTALFYNHRKCTLTPFHCKKSWRMALTFRSGDKLLWCDHPDETVSAVLSHGTIHLLV